MHSPLKINKRSVSIVSDSHRKKKEKKEGKQRGVRELPKCPLLYTHSYSLFLFITPSSQPHPAT